jgi:branched-chain amino acid transport system ATP-binding protein
MELVHQICERVYVLDFGQMIFEGGTEEMLTNDAVRAAYLGVRTEALVGHGIVDGEVAG